jgi:hypothetical protein
MSEEKYDILSSDTIRHDLIEYYKWVVNLAVFVLTSSVSLVAIFDPDLKHKWLLILAWVFLGLCIALNWLIVKR